MLKVTVHHGQNFASGLLPSPNDRPCQSALVAAPYDTKARKVGTERLGRFPGSVGAVVIHHDNLEGSGGRRQHPMDPFD
jgi:hypothetical protein